ncbi:MAG TPA: hypothetical protein VK694_07630 [Verrucomicrobiae bacterium]|nr:hypothetical protein [Verrucomicrobiae bacterium]
MATAHPKYYQIQPKKLFWLSAITFNLYEIYWFYKNWQAIKEAEHSDIRLVWRAIFAVFFVNSLFKKIATDLKLTQLGRYTRINEDRD